MIIQCEQRSEEWFQARLGKITGTGFSAVLAGGSGKTRDSYMLKLIAERLSGEHEEGYTNEAMERGIELEDEARTHYEETNVCVVPQIGFFLHDDFANWIGVSPDGLVGKDGLLEIKCPKATTHIKYLLTNTDKPRWIDPAYTAQIQGQLWVTDRKWCDWVSYAPQIPDRPMLVVRVERDEEYINNLAEKCQLFISEMKKKLDVIAGV